MPTASETAPPVRPASFSPTSAGEHVEIDGVQPELGEDRRSSVDGEVVAGIHGAGGDQRQHGDGAFAHHRAVADEAGVGFLPQHLRRGAGGDQRVEAGDRAAGDGHEQERKELAADDRAAAVNELRVTAGTECWDER